MAALPDDAPSRTGGLLSRVRAWHLVALCVLFTLALRLPFLTTDLMRDEAGLLLVARHWSGGEYLYGHYFVGRGMLAVGVYKVGDLLGGAMGLRLLACVVAAGLVVAAGWAGWQLRGRAGAGWAALVAAAYGSTHLFQAQTMNERLVATALVMVSCAVFISALSHPDSWPRAVAYGALATLPLLVVQSYADGLAFGGVSFVVAVATRRLPVRQGVRLALGTAGGILLTALGVTLVLLATPMTTSEFWFQMFGFRLRAADVIGVHTSMPGARLESLFELAAQTGMILIVVCLLVGVVVVRRRGNLLPYWFGVLAMFAVSLYGMYAGADYWTDYLLQPVPALALAVALVAPSPSLSGWAMRLAGVVAAVGSVVALFLHVTSASYGQPTGETRVGTWVRDAAHPGDTGTVIWGEANLLYAADLRSPYPYFWSLVTRTLDPHLHRAVALFGGPDAPTWVVLWLPTNTWDLDKDGELSRTLHERYRVVGMPCGKPVLLLRGLHRDLLPDSAC